MKIDLLNQERHAIHLALQFIIGARDRNVVWLPPDPTMIKLLKQLYERTAPQTSERQP